MMPTIFCNRERPWLSVPKHFLGVLGVSTSVFWAGIGHAATPDMENAMEQLNRQFSSEVIIPGYQALGLHMESLVQAARSFEGEPTEMNLAAIRSAWLNVVSQWASSNAVAFGPVHSLGYSTALESPVDETGIDLLLADVAESEDFKVALLLPSLQGFEAMAYVLSTEGEKTAADFSRQERRYLTALTVRAQEVTTDILTVWQAGWNSYPAYSTLLSTAGSPGNAAYLSVQAGSEEIVRTIINSLDVVAGEELPDIVETSAMMAETPDATTLQLLNSSLQGIQSAYLGVVGEPSEDIAGVSELVAIANPTIDDQIQTSLVSALDNIEQAMGNPNDVASLVQAQASLELAFELLETEVLPLVQN
ncbi:MAG: imelysin family protein [Cyanobacteria bacterium P01_D01_bin.156]